MKEMTHGDREMQAFLAECEKMSAIELEHRLQQKYLKSTWRMEGRRMLDRKRVAEAIERQRIDDDLSRRNTAAAESQAASARSANRRATVALVFSVIAIVITAIQAIPAFLSLLGKLR